MSVEFDEPEYQTPSPIKLKPEKGIIGLLFKYGLAKNKTQANLIMIGIIVVMVIVFIIAISSL